jgi:hypothetical protein
MIDLLKKYKNQGHFFFKPNEVEDELLDIHHEIYGCLPRWNSRRRN